MVRYTFGGSDRLCSVYAKYGELNFNGTLPHKRYIMREAKDLTDYVELREEARELGITPLEDFADWFGGNEYIVPLLSWRERNGYRMEDFLEAMKAFMEAKFHERPFSQECLKQGIMEFQGSF